MHQADGVVLFVDRETYRVSYAALDVPQHRTWLAAKNRGQMVVGTLARFLFEALTGWDMLTETPDDSTVDKAIEARIKLLDQARAANALLPLMVVAKTYRVDPWLASFPTDNRGRIVSPVKEETYIDPDYLAEYEQRVIDVY